MHQREVNRDGPYLQAAFFCERLLQEADGVFSAIRIVDHISVHEVPEASGDLKAPVPVDLTLFVCFKTGRFRGTRELHVVMQPPPGPTPVTPAERFTHTLVFVGPEDRGDTIILPISMEAVLDGVYWFSIYLDEELITRVPLHVDRLG